MQRQVKRRASLGSGRCQKNAVANPPPHGGHSWMFLRLTTDEGIVGFREAYTQGLQPSPAATVQLIQDGGKGLLLGLTRSASNDCGGNSS